ncbi:MAG: sugar transferase [Gemmatimonadaceae bacterium]|nr:sugar transferase [Gemmatimonadaceae bacterium]
MPIHKRAFDLLLAVPAAVILAVPFLLVAVAVRLTSEGPVLFWSDRVGRENALFRMPKVRTMRVNTPAVATHLLTSPKQHLTPIGGLLRKTSLDEIPQLWSVIRGDMSIVGPRPALFNQDDLVAQRTAVGVHHLTPGITGWAQINGRDELSIPEKVAFDAAYLQRRGFVFDLRIIVLTFWHALRGTGVTH